MKNQFISASDHFSHANEFTMLYKDLWREKTTLLLHGDRNADKTSAALDLVIPLADKGHKVLYVDTQHRLDNHSDRLGNAGNIYIFHPEYESPDDPADYADLVISGIEEAIATTDIRLFVVDSVSRIAALSFGRNASQAFVMKRLVAIQIRYGISLIVIAYDSSKSADRAIALLADTEISVNASVPAENTEIPAAQTLTDIPATVMPHAPCPGPALNRSQRRALEREQRKHSCKTRR